MAFHAPVERGHEHLVAAGLSQMLNNMGVHVKVVLLGDHGQNTEPLEGQSLPNLTVADIVADFTAPTPRTFNALENTQ